MKCDREARTRALVLGAVAGAMLFGAGAASASITYIVDQTIGGGSVTGQMVTDGATGAITPSDFLSWNLVLSGPGASFTLTQGNSVVYEQGSDLDATPTQISFNYSGSDNGLFLVQDGLFSGDHYWCNAPQAGDCAQGKSVAPIDFSDSSTQDVGASGVETIMTVPEPATWALMLVGFAALGCGAYRQCGKARLVAEVA